MMANGSNNTAMEHIIKQRKKKDLPNSKVYGSIDSVVDMHDIEKYEINDKKLGIIIKELYDENESANKRIDKAKEVITELLSRLEKVERKMKEYGI